jgi:Ser/Thr protein kinase RdoA (MazF antagonist)
MEFLPGRTLHKLEGPERAASAGRYVGRFHRALSDWNHAFRAPRLGVHDTLRHMAYLDETLRTVTEHPLRGEVVPVADRIRARWAAWRGTVEQRERVAHGDLKISNLRFDATGTEVAGILDLDTLTTFPFSVEMGDAWRSWCNPATEDDLAGTRFDAALFEASLEGWLSTAPPLDRDERAALVPGIERICVELSARFCADALNNRYFREDRQKYPQVGTHCLARARAQLRLAEDVAARAEDLEGIVRSA